MVSALVSRSSGPRSRRAGRRNSVVFFGETYTLTVPLSPPGRWVLANLTLGVIL